MPGGVLTLGYRAGFAGYAAYPDPSATQVRSMPCRLCARSCSSRTPPPPRPPPLCSCRPVAPTPLLLLLLLGPGLGHARPALLGLSARAQHRARAALRDPAGACGTVSAVAILGSSPPRSTPLLSSLARAAPRHAPRPRRGRPRPLQGLPRALRRPLRVHASRALRGRRLPALQAAGAALGPHDGRRAHGLWGARPGRPVRRGGQRAEGRWGVRRCWARRLRRGARAGRRRRQPSRREQPPHREQPPASRPTARGGRVRAPGHRRSGAAAAPRLEDAGPRHACRHASRVYAQAYAVLCDGSPRRCGGGSRSGGGGPFQQPHSWGALGRQSQAALHRSSSSRTFC